MRAFQIEDHPLMVTRRATGLGFAATLLAGGVRADVGYDSPENHGARGDGRTDDMAAWRRALASGRPVRGDPRKVYGLTGNLELPRTAWIEQARFRQLTPNGVNRRTLTATGSTKIVLDRVSVDRGDDPDSGTLRDSAGILLANVAAFTLKDCEVSGDGRGAGVLIAGCDKGEIVRGSFHDMVAGSPRGRSLRDGDDQLIGLWIVGSSNIRVTGTRVANLLTQWAGQRPTSVNTRGFCLGGGGRGGVSFSNCVVSNVEEGFDFTGDGAPRNWSVSDSRAENCRLLGFKAAVTASQGVYERCVAYRCGLTGFIAGGAPRLGCDVVTHSIVYSDCSALETGYGRPLGPQQRTFGFRVDANARECPRGITWLRCKAIGGGDMNVGFQNDAQPSGASERNRAIDCETQGALDVAFKGLENERRR